jgi:hypothetical protein
MEHKDFGAGPASKQYAIYGKANHYPGRVLPWLVRD